MKKSILVVSASLALFLPLGWAQQAIQVGGGSYAAYAPYAESTSSDHTGCDAYTTEHRTLYLTPEAIASGRPIPSNDWWTDLIVSPYSGDLWAYPQKVGAMSTGIRVEFPSYWGDTGNEVYSHSTVNVGGVDFYPPSANADDWHDWGFRFALTDSGKGKTMKVTLAHGIPFTWVETSGLTAYLQCDGAEYIVDGEVTAPPFASTGFVLRSAGDNYGVYAPAGTRFVMSDRRLEARFAQADAYLVIAALPSADDLDLFGQYARNVPRNTEVTYRYAASEGKLKTYWNITTENLDGGAAGDVIQGFIPHHYKDTERNFDFIAPTYLTPRGTMKTAVGRSFEIDYAYNGVLPFYPKPELNAALANPYDRDRMVSMISDYVKKGSFGGDTYWGGKGLTQMAHYMCFAHELGETELFEMAKSRLRSALENWLTYTPGEEDRYFAYFPTWGALVGFNVSYGSDTFNDHHFHYGYYTYSSALLAMFDEEFRDKYGDMITLVARDYANWDRSSTDFPLFRTLDPWCGHSFAGGMGGSQGNGQESSSEAMQGWGGVLMLGAALGNEAMRDAGIFGYVMEARATAEYWFDRDRENIDYTKYTHPWSTNLTTQGVGWWTWFSGDPVWMHSIQWLPISPLLKYLYEDPAFAKWDFETMMAGKEMGDWAEDGGLGSESGIGNVCLSYKQIYDPDSAAAIFDQMWDGGYALAKNTDTGGITYYITHMHRTYGEIQWNLYSDHPLSTAYYNATSGKYYYVVYNPSSSEETVTFYDDGTPKVQFKAPANRLTVYSDAPVLTRVEVSAPAATVARSSVTPLTAVAYDQYGATMDASFDWTATAGSMAADGRFTAPAANTEVTVTAASGAVSGSLTLRVNDAPTLSSAVITPATERVQVGAELTFSLTLSDQYGDPYSATRVWTVTKDGSTVTADSAFTASEVGTYTVSAAAGGQTYTRTVLVLPAYPNIALGMTCTASSQENGGTSAANATDGSYTTRWSSSHNDGEWIYADLGEDCYIGSVGVEWEAAYASSYLVQVSDNASDWTTLATVAGSKSYILTEAGVNGRYVRIYGVERATNYGVSLYELEVFGLRSSLSDDEVLGLDITPKVDCMTEAETLQLTATAYNKKGEAVDAAVTWAVTSGNATISASGLLTPTSYGTVVVSATASGVTSTRSLLVEEVPHVETLAVTPAAAYLVSGESQDFSAVAYDQFGGAMSGASVTFRLEGEGSSLTGNTFLAGANGDYLLIATSGAVSDTAYVTVTTLGNINLALNKHSSCSSYEGGGTLASNVNDGDYTTRWGSGFNDGEYVEIDLEGYYNLNLIKVFWQEAYATEYSIEVSMDEESWTTVYSTTECAGGDESLSIAETAARYVRLTGDKRYNAAWGTSVREIEVYGSSVAEAPYPVEVQILPPYVFYLGEPVQLTAQIINQYGTEMKQDPLPVFTVNGGGTISEYGVFTPSETGDWVLGVDFNGQVSNGCGITVKERRRLASIVLVPASDLVVRNTEIAITAYGYDQYGNSMEVTPSWSTDLGTVTDAGLFSSAAVGTATITAAYGGVSGTCEVRVYNELVDNLALNKPVYASSGTPERAVDGNEGSRWESSFSDPQWLYVDLGDVYQLSSVQILWETASASDYRIQVSNDAENWVTVLTVNDLPAGNRIDEFSLGGVGRYVRYYGDHRTTNYGHSFYELRLYGVLLEAGVPYTIEFVNPVTAVKTRLTYDYDVIVKDKNGTALSGQTVIWSATGGTINNAGEYMASEAGAQIITASVGNVRAELTVTATLNTGVDEVSEAIVWWRESDLILMEGSSLRRASLYDASGRLLARADGQSRVVLPVAGRSGVAILLMERADGTREMAKIRL